VASSSLLDTIAENLGSFIAPVEWHVYNGSPLYNAEGYAKWLLYPGGGGGTPWLYVDGVDCGYDINTWRGAISNARRNLSDVSITHIGTTYDSASRSGQVQVECFNSGGSSIDAAVQFVITEDSIYYVGSNGDAWHNHVCRDYVPDQNGTAVTIAAGAADTVTIPYSIDNSWVQEKVNLVLYLQNMTSKSCYQGIARNLINLTGVEEPSKLYSTGDIRVQVGPNPCRAGCEFALSGAAARDARIAMYAPDGRLVSDVQTAGNRATWSRNGVSRGVYLYRVVAGAAAVEGKLVVTD
jgi:hypothetical protein